MSAMDLWGQVIRWYTVNELWMWTCDGRYIDRSLLYIRDCVVPLNGKFKYGLRLYGEDMLTDARMQLIGITWEIY